MKTICSGVDTNREYDEYPELLAQVSSYPAGPEVGTPLFTTDTQELFKVFLMNLPADARQHYNCRACEAFLNSYGTLVWLDKTGKQFPVLPSENLVPEFFHQAFQAMGQYVQLAKVTGVFVSEEKIFGKPVTGTWHHMAVQNRNQWRSRTQTAHQQMAEKAEDHRLLWEALTTISIAQVSTALRILDADVLYRSEKVQGVAKWFQDVMTRVNKARSNRTKNNIVWLAVATAPSGFCHIKSTMIGTLLDDIEQGLSFEVISKRFAEKMHPLRYQRPTAPPAEGNVKQAEKIVMQLWSEGSLKRRYARLDEIQKIWEPRRIPATPLSQVGVFHQVTPKGSGRYTTPPTFIPTITMTWVKFRATVLPQADAIEFAVPSSHNNYAAILTAEDLSAPPILQWDHEEYRNPFSWYVYNGGSAPSTWRLQAGSWTVVTGVCLQPSMWEGEEKYPHHGKSVTFILAGAKDEHHNRVSLALFPELLKAEYHSIAATIEAYSKKNHPTGYEQSSACGIRLQANSSFSQIKFRVMMHGQRQEYILDRWD